MSGHVYVRILGHGLAVIPVPGVRVFVASDGSEVLHFIHEEMPLSSVALDPVMAGVSPKGVQGIFDLTAVESPPEWRLQTSVYTVGWPKSYSLVPEVNPQGPTLYNLFGPQNEMVYVQGPFENFRITTVEKMATEGQTITSNEVHNGARVAHLTYIHQRGPWSMVHMLVPWDNHRTMVVSGQSPSTQASGMLVAAKTLAESFA